MTDLELAGAMTALLPKEYRDKLSASFARFERAMKSIPAETKEGKYWFCRYMELYWLAVYPEKNEYSELQKLTCVDWRKRSERVHLKLKRKVAIV